MAVQIDTYGAAGLGSAGYGGRQVARMANGRLLALFRDSANNRLEVWYSDDQGATWAENTSARVSLHANFAAVNWSISVFVDADDNVHIAYLGGGLDSYTFIWYRVGATVGTGGAFGSEYEVRNDWGTGYVSSHLSLVAHANISAGTGWKVHIAYGMTGASYYTANIRTLTLNTSYAVTGVTDQTNYTTTTICDLNPRLDFHHTGDGKTIQGSTPHLYLAHGYASGVACVKYTYSGGTWTIGTLRQVDSGSIIGGFLDASFDGAQFNVVYVLAATNTVVRFSERDAADTTTTARTPTALSDGAVLDLSVTHQGPDRSVVVGAIGTTSDDAKYSKFDRTAGTWGSWTALEAGTATRVSAARGTLGRRVDFVWDDSGTSVRHGQVVYNTAPTAATWVTPVDFAGADVGAALVLDWTFTDPDLEDSQTAYAVRRQIGAGTLYYWRASDSTWQTTETKNVTTTTSLTLASSWGADGDANHKYAVKTWDVLDAEGVYSAELTVVPSTPDLPTITTPTDASTWVTSSLTVVWTVTTQTTYLVELLDAAGTSVLATSGTLSSTSVRSHAVAYTLANGVSYKARVTTANDEGLVGTADTNSFSVAYTAPATPTLTVTGNTPTGAITVEHANPTPGGSQPTVTSCDVFVRCTAGTYPDGERPVAGDGIRVKTGLTPGANWIDYAPASGRAYQYLVRAYGDNGTTADSAWTS